MARPAGAPTPSKQSSAAKKLITRHGFDLRTLLILARSNNHRATEQLNISSGLRDWCFAGKAIQFAASFRIKIVIVSSSSEVSGSKPGAWQLNFALLFGDFWRFDWEQIVQTYPSSNLTSRWLLQLLSQNLRSVCERVRELSTAHDMTSHGNLIIPTVFFYVNVNIMFTKSLSTNCKNVICSE